MTNARHVQESYFTKFSPNKELRPSLKSHSSSGSFFESVKNLNRERKSSISSTVMSAGRNSFNLNLQDVSADEDFVHPIYNKKDPIKASMTERKSLGGITEVNRGARQ